MVELDREEYERHSSLMWWLYSFEMVRFLTIGLCRVLPDAGARWVLNATPMGACLVAFFRQSGDLAEANAMRFWLWTGRQLDEVELSGSSLDEPCGSAEQRPRRAGRKSGARARGSRSQRR